METLQRTANRGSLSTGYDIDNSVKTEAGNNEWFYRSSPTASSTQTKFTFSFWHKRTQITGYPADPYLMSQGSNARFHITGNANPTLRFMFDGGSTELESSPRLRDTAAWYHIVLAVDTTQATASNRVKLYVNGEQISWDNSAYPSQNATSTWMSTTNMYFNTRDGDGSYDASGYYAEICVIDGQQLAPTDFGEFDSNSGIWKPIDVSGLTFGNEGFYLDFEDSSDLGADVSGNNNDCTLNNIAAVDQATDTPTNNFCTLNQLWKYANVPSVLNCTDGGTIIQHNGSWSGAKATMGVQNGKWYWECKIGQRENTMWGIQTDGEDNIGSGNAQDNKSTHVLYSGFGSGGYLITTQNGTIAADTSNYSAVWSSGDIAGIALDMDNNQITYYRNGSGLGSAFTAITIHDNADKVNFPFIATYREYIKINFGGYSDWETGGNSDANGYGSFQYSVPSGYYALCTKNLAEYG